MSRSSMNIVSGSGVNNVMVYGHQLFPLTANEWPKVGGNVPTTDAMIQNHPGIVQRRRKNDRKKPDDQ